MGSIMMKTKGQETRDSIIEKSLELFTLKGYFNTSIRDIIEATGLTKGGVYGHFVSKEDIWYAAYDEASRRWKAVVFKGVRYIEDPMSRIERVIDNVLRNYVGRNVFHGGAFFVPLLMELSGQEPNMSGHILKGFESYKNLFISWIKEADEKGMLRPGLNHNEIGEFILIALNGATTLYVATQDPNIWKKAISQLKFYVEQLRMT